MFEDDFGGAGADIEDKLLAELLFKSATNKINP